jgi:hypothetical protein
MASFSTPLNLFLYMRRSQFSLLVSISKMVFSGPTYWTRGSDVKESGIVKSHSLGLTSTRKSCYKDKPLLASSSKILVYFT